MNEDYKLLALFDDSGDISLEQWLDIGKRLDAAGKHYMWEVGKWWNYGEDRYATKKLMLESSEKWQFLSYQTCRTAGWVCRKFGDLFHMETDLPFSYYKAVASLDDDTAQNLIQHCVDTQKTTGKLPGVRFLDDQVKAIRAKEAADRLVEGAITNASVMYGKEIDENHPDIEYHKAHEKSLMESKPRKKKPAQVIKEVLESRPDLVDAVNNTIRLKLHPDKPTGDKELFGAVQESIERKQKADSYAMTTARQWLDMALSEEPRLVKIAAQYLMQHSDSPKLKHAVDSAA